jgi:hypothetical protein
MQQSASATPVASVSWFLWIWRGYVAAATISAASFIAVLASVIVAEKDRSFPLMDVVPEYLSTNDGSMRIAYSMVEEGSVSLGALLLVAFGADFIGFAAGAAGLYDLQGYLEAGFHPMQLVQFIVSAAPVSAAIALVSGVTSTYALLCIVTLHVLTMLCGMVAGVLGAIDRQRSSTTTLVQRRRRGGAAMSGLLVRWGSASKWISHAAGWIAQVVTWLVFALAFAAALRISYGSPPKFVFALYTIMALVYAWFGAAQLATLVGIPRATVELVNVVVSPAGKLVTYWFLYINVFAPM